MAIYMAAADDVFGGDYICVVVFPLMVFWWDLGLNCVSFWVFSFLLLYIKSSVSMLM